MVAAAVGIGTAVAGAYAANKESGAATDAANTQAQAANQASQLQSQQFQQAQSNLSPYMSLGTSTIPQLQKLLGGPGLNSQFNFNHTQAQLEQTPGYQFSLQQGLKGVDNAASAKGLGLSGAQFKGISDYTTGMASQTYQQQYQNALQNFMTNYGVNSDQANRLSGLVSLGQNSAAGVGNMGLSTASSIGNLLTGAANARAAGTIGSANALSSGVNSLGQGAALYSLLSRNNSNSNIYPPAYDNGSDGGDGGAFSAGGGGAYP